jgi:hypothetical protein
VIHIPTAETIEASGIPDVRLTKAFAIRKLYATHKIIVGIHVTGHCLETRDSIGDEKPDDKKKEIVTPGH